MDGEGHNIEELQAVEILEIDHGSIVLRYSDDSVFIRENGTLSWRNNNPGNLKYGPFAKSMGAIGPGWHNHSVFPNLQMGHDAQKELLFGMEREYHTLNLNDALAKYAPYSDGGHPDQYVAYVAQQANVNPTRILGEYTDEEKDRVVMAMTRFEGFKPGDVIWLRDA